MFLDIGGGASGLWRAVRRRASRRMLPFAAIAGAFIFLLLGSATLAVSLGDLERSFEDVHYTERILRHARDLAAQISSAEVATRGYMLAEEPQYLETLNRDRSGISKELHVLAELSAGDAPQLQRLGAIDKHLRFHLGNYVQPLAPGDAQLTFLVSHLRAGGGLRMDRELDVPLSQFRDAEFLGLRERQERAAQEVTEALAVAVFVLVLALASGAAGLYLIARMRSREELEKVREEFAHVSRLNMMGEVAATLAHEVKQPLTASSNYLSVMKRQLANEDVGRDKVAEVVDKISAQVGRAVDIIQHLRTHVSQTGGSAAPESVEETINEAISLSGIRQSHPAIGIRIEEQLPRVCIDKVQIQQVLVNLMRNAMEAMEGCPRRRIVISARRSEHRMVRIEIRDSGPGLPAEVRANLFKPFVTTKESGMGVGLSICRSIVQAHGGNIEAIDAPDGGTIFSFTVPET